MIAVVPYDETNSFVHTPFRRCPGEAGKNDTNRFDIFSMIAVVHFVRVQQLCLKNNVNRFDNFSMIAVVPS